MSANEVWILALASGVVNGPTRDYSFQNWCLDSRHTWLLYPDSTRLLGAGRVNGEIKPRSESDTGLVSRSRGTREMEESPDLSDERTLSALDANYLASSCAMMGSSAVGAYAEQSDLAMVSCGAPIARFNVAHLKRTLADPDSALARAEEYFDRIGLPYCVEYRDRHGEVQSQVQERLRKAGFVRTEPALPGMALAPIRPAPSRPPVLSIERVDDRLREAFVRTAAVGFGFPPEAGGMVFSSAFINRPEMQAFAGLIDGEVVATSMLFQSGFVAGIYWVSTLPEWRCRGYGAAVTWAAVDAGARAGCRVASLQASAMGKPVYARMGFSHPINYVRWERPTSA